MASQKKCPKNLVSDAVTLSPFQSCHTASQKVETSSGSHCAQLTLRKNRYSLQYFPLSSFTWSASESEGTTNTTSPLCKVSSSEFAASKSCSVSTCKIL